MWMDSVTQKNLGANDFSHMGSREVGQVTGSCLPPLPAEERRNLQRGTLASFTPMCTSKYPTSTIAMNLVRLFLTFEGYFSLNLR